MKKITKKCRVLLVAVLSLTMLVGATMSANAASANVMITIEETDIEAAITVPTTIPIVFNADGSNTYPTNWTITNNAEFASVKLYKVVGNTMTTGWKLLNNLEEVKDLKKDTQSMRFSMGVPGKMKLLTTGSGSESYASYGNDGIQIKAGESETIQFEVERGAFSEAKAEAVAVQLTLMFEFI